MHHHHRLPLIAAASLALIACRKEREGNTADRDFTAALDNGRAEFYFNDALKQGETAFKDGTLPCSATVTIDLDAQPHTLLIDFGAQNCTGADGLRRRGRLLFTFTGPYGQQGTVITLTPQEYHVNDLLLQGTKVVTNLGPNAQGQTHFSVQVNGTVTAPDASWTSTHTYQRVRTWIAGEGTPNPFDDVYLITGGGSGVNRFGQSFTVTITTPLRVEVGCPWIVSGVQEVSPQGRPVRVIDFGSGACDSQVTVTVNGFTFTVGGG
jgi:hypothetical protein